MPAFSRAPSVPHPTRALPAASAFCALVYLNSGYRRPRVSRCVPVCGGGYDCVVVAREVLSDGPQQ